LRKILLGIVAVIIIILAAGAIFVRHLARKGLPDYNTDVSLAGLRESVTVCRDSFAIPHIYAQNENDLYLATGYVMAQDRLWQMDLIRRVTEGRLAEIFGEGLVDADLFMRALRIPEKSRLVLGQTEEPVLAGLRAFSDGVNRYIESCVSRHRLPLEFSLLGYAPEKWTPEHSANLIGYMARDLAFAMDSDLLLYRLGQKLPLAEGRYKELLPDLGLQKAPVFPDFKLDGPAPAVESTLFRGARKLDELGLAVFAGSNNWAVSGSRSATGKPILANDMHLLIFAPGIWYQIHQVVEGKLNVTGVALPGSPVITAGHNDRIAWGFTNVMNDDVDFYREKINPANPGEYEFNGSWRSMETRRETIRVRKGKPLERTLRFTHRGPVISELKGIPDAALSMRWVGNDMSNELLATYRLNRARNWEEFTAAVREFRALSQNIVYADVDGNIGLYCCGGVPIRKGGIGIAPGETDEYDWKGYVPFEELPHVYNPPSGVVSSANNKTAGDDYPHYISYLFFAPYRINRIREMLSEKEKLSVEDFRAMQLDVRSKLVERMKGELLAEIGKREKLGDVEGAAREILETWDGRVTGDSAAALLFDELYIILLKNLIEDELGPDLYKEFAGSDVLAMDYIENTLADKNAESVDDVRTPGVRETWSDIVQKSFQEAVASLAAKFGRDTGRWRWDRVHHLVIKHPMASARLIDRVFRLSQGPYPAGGSFHTVCPFYYPLSQGFDSDSGASQRHIYSLADWNDSLTVIPTGESGVPASPFYCDQTKLYVAGQYHSDHVDRGLVEKNARFRMTLRPAQYK
jgi:penicillin amidase